MSRFNYLAGLLFFLIIGYLLFAQLISATETAVDLMKKEICHGLKVRINNFFYKNRRYPDSKNEIEQLIESFKTDCRNLVKMKFVKGDKLNPASYIFRYDSYKKAFFFEYIYFGCEYRKDYNKRGHLVSRSHIP